MCGVGWGQKDFVAYCGRCVLIWTWTQHQLFFLFLRGPSDPLQGFRPGWPKLTPCWPLLVIGILLLESCRMF